MQHGNCPERNEISPYSVFSAMLWEACYFVAMSKSKVDFFKFINSVP